MNPNPYLAAVRRSWVYAVVAIVVGTLAGLALSLAATPLYSSTATLYFSSGFSASATDLNQGSAYTQAQMLSFAELAKSPTVLAPVIDSLGLDTTPRALAGTIDATTPQDTVVLEITASSRDASAAAQLANAVADSLSTQAEKLAPATTGKSKPLTVSVVGTATESSVPSSPDVARNVLAGLVVGVIAAILIVVLRQQYDTRVVSAAALAGITELPLLGTVEKRRHDARPATRFPAIPESYRQLGASLAATSRKAKRSVLVTSAIPGEGTSTTALGLAVALSEHGRPVLVIDANLRRPGLAALASVDGTAGLAEVLEGRTNLADAVRPSAQPGLSVLAAGAATGDPGALLSSAELPALLASAKARYDIVIVDAAPISIAADAAIIGASLDGAVVVADSTRVRAAQLTGALEALDRSGVTILGVVLNRAHPHRHRYSPRAHGAESAAPSEDAASKTVTVPYATAQPAVDAITPDD